MEGSKPLDDDVEMPRSGTGHMDFNCYFILPYGIPEAKSQTPLVLHGRETAVLVQRSKPVGLSINGNTLRRRYRKVQACGPFGTMVKRSQHMLYIELFVPTSQRCHSQSHCARLQRWL